MSVEKPVFVFTHQGHGINSASNRFVSTIMQKNKDDLEISFSLELFDSVAIFMGIYEGARISKGLWEKSESYASHYKGNSFEIMPRLAFELSQ